jgi:hypothetical protein
MGWRHQDVIAKLEAKRKVRSAAYYQVRRVTENWSCSEVLLFIIIVVRVVSQIKKSKAALKNTAKKSLSAKKPAILKEYGY